MSTLEGLDFISQLVLHVNKTNFHMKGFALGLTLKQKWKATRQPYTPYVEKYWKEGVGADHIELKSY